MKLSRAKVLPGEKTARHGPCFTGIGTGAYAVSMDGMAYAMSYTPQLRS
jgi:hypothetical protein